VPITATGATTDRVITASPALIRAINSQLGLTNDSEPIIRPVVAEPSGL
jgi:hypothetical protein